MIGSLDISGTERHLATIAPRLKERGWQPVIYCLAARGAQAQDAEKAGVTVIAPTWEIKASQTSFGKFVRTLLSAAKLFTILVRRRPQIVHFFLPAAYLIGAPLAIASRRPFRIMSRRSLNLYQQKYRNLRFFEHQLHRKMHALVGNSEAVTKELRHEAGNAPVALIYNGVDISKYTPLPSRERKPDTLRLIIVANLIPYKGHADLFRALSLISHSLPSSWELLCVGRDDGIGAALAEEAKRLQIDGHIRILGSRTDIPELLASADIGILCSHQEGFSNAVLEGMAAGLPMVVTDVGGNAEAVLDRTTGFVVPAHDPNSLGKAILSLAFDPQMRAQMSKAGRLRAEKHFSLDRCIDDYDALYRRLATSLKLHAVARDY